MLSDAVAIAAWLLALAQAPAGREAKRFEFAQAHMGSQFKIVLYTTDESAARRASDAAFARIAHLDSLLSDYDPDSELSRLGDAAGGPPARVSPELFFILDRSQDIARRSGGAFDGTVAPVVRLWRRARRTRKLPDPDTLARARALVGYENLELDPKAQTARLRKPGMRLDLGGIAKGYASGEAIAVLRREGIDRALVAGSGDIVVSGPPPGRDGWTIGVGPLDDPDKPPSRYVTLRDAAVSTSGDAEQFVEIDGTRYSHIVDPHTGLGLTERISVTVVAPDGATADALDTTACVLGPKRGLELIEATPGAAALIVRRTDRGLETIASSRWADAPADPSAPPSAQLQGGR